MNTLLFSTSILTFPPSALEIGAVIFWLTTWALLASEASLFDSALGYYGYGLTKNGNSALGCTKGAAALGAFTWVFFVVSLVFFGMSPIRLPCIPFQLKLTHAFRHQPPPHAHRRWSLSRPSSSGRRHGANGSSSSWPDISSPCWPDISASCRSNIPSYSRAAAFPAAKHGLDVVW